MTIQIVLWLALAGAAPQAVAASHVSFDQETETLVDGRPTGSLVHSRAFIADRRMRVERADSKAEPSPTLIVRLDQGRAWRIDPAGRVAWEVDLAREQTRSQVEMGVVGDLIGERLQAAPLPRSRRIAGYDCRGYRLKTAAGAIEVWMTTALPVDAESFSALLEWLGAEQAMGGYLDALRRLTGFPLETRARLDVAGRVVETRSTVTRVKIEALADSLFEPPAGYRIEPSPPEEP